LHKSSISHGKDFHSESQAVTILKIADVGFL